MDMSLNLNTLAASRCGWPAWNKRARLRRVDSQRNVIPGEYACNGEHLRVSPRYMKNGACFRVRPERPAAFFAAWLHERGVLPTLLTAEECAQEWALDLLDP